MRRVDAVVTVNEALADHCQRIWPFRERPTVLLNGQPRWDPPAVAPGPHPRRPPACRRSGPIVLFLGRLGRQRGLEEAADAVIRLRDAALVMLGLPPSPRAGTASSRRARPTRATPAGT